jgi:hypothetical protein
LLNVDVEWKEGGVCVFSLYFFDFGAADFIPGGVA